VNGKRSAARALGWLTTLPYRLPGRRVSIASGLLGNGRLRIGGPGRVRLAGDINAWSHAEPNRLVTTTPRAEIIIGRNARLNGCILVASESIEVGDDCVLGSCEIRDHLPSVPRGERPYLPASGPVVIENNVWVGGQVSILPGVRIGRNSVVGIHSVVVQSVPANVLVAGNPARVIRSLAPHPDDNSGR
jgi:acetyltransferase-like isoleucine patch superfamily enzyme